MYAGNPFQSPLTSQNDTAKEGAIRVENGILIVPNQAVLPLRCAVSNAPLTSSDHKERVVYYCSLVFIGAALVMGPIGVFLVYLLTRRKRTVTYGMTSAIRKRIQSKENRKFAVFVLVVILCVGSFVAGSSPWIIGSLVAFVCSIIYLGWKNDPISLKADAKGEVRISGCGADFIESVLAEREGKNVPYAQAT